MTTNELKHQAGLQVWSQRVQNCRGSGLSVRRWCREQGITTTTYYRWEREILAAASNSVKRPQGATVFAELPSPGAVQQNSPERTATLRIGEHSIDLYQQMDPQILKTLVELLRSC